MGGFSRFFIYRPVFALVIAIIIVLLGIISIPILPVESMPDITPPTVEVSTTYPGASADVLAQTVAQPIEQEVNGVEDMLYMSSKSAASGSYSLTVYFEVGTDVDMATVLVQNRVAVAEPLLPEEVKRQGVKVKKKSTQMVLAATLFSPDGRYDDMFISNYATTRIKDVIARVEGVGEVTVFGAKDFGMRVWLDPQRLKARGLTTTDIVSALREQNVQVAAGKIGEPPTPGGQSFEYTVTTVGRLTDPEQFQDIIVKRGGRGQVVRLRDVARVELGSQTYAWYARQDGAPTAMLGVNQIPGSNALAVAQGIKQVMEDLSGSFPEGLEWSIPYDSTEYISQSIDEVVETLFVAILLVIFTVWIFLQDWRTTLVPAVTIPVSLIGTFAVMLATGQSINNLTLFGLVLAIGIVVDDAIVVVENTMRLMDTEGLSAKEATSKAMGEVGGAIVATTLVLLAVFVPSLFLPGLTGRMYRPFAITISVATIFSSINALTLSPALCGLLLRPSPKTRRGFFKWFNAAFDRGTSGYTAMVRGLIRRAGLAFVVVLLLLAAAGFGLTRLPAGFVPSEDQGFFFVNGQLPASASLERTDAIIEEMEKILLETPGVKHVLSVGGYSMLDSIQGSNYGFAIATLEPWDEREHTVPELMQMVQPRLAEIEQGIVFAFGPPPISGLGAAGGFQMELQDRGDSGLMLLERVANDILAAGTASPELTRLNQNLRAGVPQLYADVDREKAKRMNVPLQSVFDTLNASLGSAYVNDFNLFGRTWRVMVQADQPFRMKPEDINRLEVRSADGKMVPLSTLVRVSSSVGPETVNRFNMFPSATITGSPAPGFSEGQAVDEIERITRELTPASIGYEWSGVTQQQKAAGNLAPVIFGLAIVLVFLFLSAQYESWSTPLSVLLSVPLAVLGAVLLTMARSLDNDIYFQIGMILLIGLCSKSAILIVEFAKQLREEGNSIFDAALTAARLRFRAILMTAFSFILGVMPLVVATGAGANSRVSLGTAVFGGMLVGTFAGVFVIPLLYFVVQSLSEKVGGKKKAIPAGLVMLFLVLPLSGCLVGPNYQPPVVEMPDAWEQSAVADVEAGEAAFQTWWTVFDDPQLTSLIERARVANLDLRRAVWRIEEARASYGVARGERYPGVGASGEVSRSEQSENLVPGAEATNLFALGADSSWEIDVFGRIRRGVRAADAGIAASVEDYRDVLVTLLAEVGLNYFELRSLQERLAYAEANILIQRETLQITKDRFDAGLVSQLDITQAESNLANTEAQVPPLRAGLVRTLNRLAVLLGEYPGSLDGELSVELEPGDIVPVLPSGVAAGLPVELLRQRPDIRGAERSLAAQAEQIGIRTADLYPRFSLFGFLGLQATEGGDLFSGDSLTWGFGLPISWNIFAGGRLRAAIDVEEARTEQALLAYEHSVLLALEEVENAMVEFHQEGLRRDKLAEAAEASGKSVELVRTQYMAGLTNFQNVLDTQRSLFSQQDQLASSRGTLVQNLVVLYKALGGGWDPELPPVPESRLDEISDGEPPAE